MPLGSLKAQTKKNWIDTSYISTYNGQLTGRVYLSQKYSSLRLYNGSTRVIYRPNTTLNLGVGATYQSLTLNLAYGFPFLNQNDAKGKTKYLDLQSHLYGRKWVYDLYGQFYRGYYLSTPYIPLFTTSSGEYYKRPDIYLRMVGLSSYHLFNGHRFSYRAALVQNEWQKKSAGSWMTGAEVYYGSIGADSTLIPMTYQPQTEIRRVHFFKIGPGVGYAYSWVLNRHFFATASLTGNLNINITKEYIADEKLNRVNVRPNLNYRAVIGYNSQLWNVSLSLVNSDVVLSGETLTNYLIRTGNYRLNVARRVPPGKHLRRLAREKKKLGL
ncbi:MAG: DUF4421 domain-containing protein [Siphonobacter sp.]